MNSVENLEKAPQAEAFEAEQRNARRRELVSQARLPHRAARWWREQGKRLGRPAYLEAAPSPCQAWNARWALVSEALLKAPKTMVLCGAQGRGKTVLGVGVARLFCWHERRARYVTLLDLALEFEAAMKPDSGSSRHAVLESYKRPDLLVIDECGRSAETDAIMRLLFAVLDGRHGDDLGTLLIGNMEPSTFNEWLGPSLVDRVNEAEGGLVHANWGGLRE
jgi:DNA replication protein DnaC